MNREELTKSLGGAGMKHDETRHRHRIVEVVAPTCVFLQISAGNPLGERDFGSWGMMKYLNTQDVEVFVARVVPPKKVLDS